MDIDRLISSRPHNATIALFGEVTEDNDRIALLQVRPGMREGYPAALMLKRQLDADMRSKYRLLRFLDLEKERVILVGAL